MGDPVGGYYEIYTTTNGGTNWVRVPQGDIPAPLSGEFGVVGYYDVIGDTIWFGTNMGRVYKSIDRGLHWTVAQTTLSEYIKPTFKDQNNGVVIDLNAEAIAYLSETHDGGTTWTTIDYTGNCYDSDLKYIPGTDNMYVSTGGASTNSGASYSLDGGHTWTEYEAQIGLQMMDMDFIEGKIGWSGAFSTDETHDGIWKYVPGVPSPAFTISIEGGKGITATINNVGEVDASDLESQVSIEGGLWIKTREFPGTETALPVGDSLVISAPVMGFGLGIFLQMPKIKVTVSCAEGVTAEKAVEAKIVFTKVILM